MMESPPSDMLVVDAGIGYALCVQDAASGRVRQDVAQVIARGVILVAPTLWRYELTSIFTKALRLGELSETLAREAFQLSQSLPVRLLVPDIALARQAFEWTLRLRRAAAYDSFYLALARQLDCELWTLDRRLRNAVDASWLRYLGGTP